MIAAVALLVLPVSWSPTSAQEATTTGYRLAGDDRYATGAAIAHEAFPDGSDVVYLARGVEPFVDALAGGALTDGPILLAPGCGTVPTAVADAIARLDPSTVTALGGESAICTPLLEAVADGRTVDRIAGPSRYDTAAAIAQRAFPDGADAVYLARGTGAIVDALAGGALTDGPILLVPGCGAVPGAVTAEVTRLAPDRVVALGGTGAVCEQVLADAAGSRPTSRLAGATRYETAAAISQHAYPDTAPVAYLARGTDPLVDALAGGVLRDGPLLLLPVGTEQFAVDAGRELDRLEPRRIVTLGGFSAIPPAVVEDTWPVDDPHEYYGQFHDTPHGIVAEFAFEHPSWGTATMQLIGPNTERFTSSLAMMIARDEQDRVRWFEIIPSGAYYIRPAAPGSPDVEPSAAVDALGHIFVEYDPGRHNGVIVMRPTRSTLDLLGTQPDDSGRGRFYFATVGDDDTDGVYEIHKTDNDCVPTCTGGTLSTVVYTWNGNDYVPPSG